MDRRAFLASLLVAPLIPLVAREESPSYLGISRTKSWDPRPNEYTYRYSYYDEIPGWPVRWISPEEARKLWPSR